jgi:hypothetical protein
MKESQTLTGKWIAILRASLSDAALAALEGAEITQRLRAARGQHRGWIVACLQAMAAIRSGERIELDGPLPVLALPALAVHGSRTAEIVWELYVRSAMGSVEAAESLATEIQRLDPTALRAGVYDNPEPWWANELLILHALQSFALQQGDASLEDPIRRCVELHIAEIQPDHATNEPWAIHAFARHPDGQMTAETLLHAAMVNNGGSLNATSQLIVGDALQALEASRER